jgi:hypothetical protein
MKYRVYTRHFQALLFDTGKDCGNKEEFSLNNLYKSVTMKVTAVWDKMPCTLANHYQRFGANKIHTTEYSS